MADAQTVRLEPFFHKSHRKPLVDDRRAQSGIVVLSRNDLRFRNAPNEYGQHNTLYNL
jgi:transposase